MVISKNRVRKMQIFFGTVVRNAPINQGGELVRLDWQSKKIEAKVSIFPTNPSLDHDPNPRGNSRGCRGIKIWQNQVIAANYHTLSIYDLDLHHQRNITDNLMVCLHETLLCDDAHIWVTSTLIDGVLKYDLNSGQLLEEFWPRENQALQKALNLKPLEFDNKSDQRSNFLEYNYSQESSHLHLNAIAQWQEQIFALFNSFGVIVNLNTGEIVIQDPAIKRAHNLIIMEDGVAICNDTYGRTIRFYDLSSRQLVQIIDITKFSWVKSLELLGNTQNFVKRTARQLKILPWFAISRTLFVRGLDRVGDLIFVGVSPASIICINWKTKQLVDAYCYSPNVQVCIHGLAVSPEYFIPKNKNPL
jgi:hypothetical protein